MGHVSTQIQFINKTNIKLDFYCVNPEGGEIHFNTLDAGGSYSQETYVGHKWKIYSQGEKLSD